MYSVLSIEDFCRKHQSFTVRRMRGYLAGRKWNGLDKHNAVSKIRGLVYIEENRFFAWLFGDKPEKK